MSRVANGLLSLGFMFAVAQLLTGSPGQRCLGEAGNPPKPTASPAAVAALPSERDCRAWAARLEQAINEGDVATCNQLIDLETILETGTALPNATPQQIESRAKFLSGFRSAFTAADGFLGQMIDTVRRGGSYKLLHLRDVEGRRRAQFRAISRTGVNYQEFILVSSPAGLPRAVDCYVFLSGELLTQTLRDGFLSCAQSWLPGGRDQLSRSDREFVEHLTEFGEMGKASAEKKFRRALDIYEKLPESVKKRKAVLLIRMNSALQVSTEEYLRTFDDYRKNYPNDAGIDLMAVTALRIQKSYDQALAALDRVDKAVLGDPQLKVFRASILREQGQLEAARKMAEAAIAEEPTLNSAYYWLLSDALRTRDFAKSAELLSALESKCHVKFKDLTKLAAYKEFVKSPEYKTWIRSHHGDKQ